MNTVKYRLIPKLLYALVRETTNENATLAEHLANFMDITSANKAARAMAEHDRRKPEDRETTTEPYVDLDHN